MLRSTLIALALAASEGAPNFYKTGHDGDAYCYGYYKAAGQDNKWCWLTSDGNTKYAKAPKCSSYKGYSANDYCKNAHYMAFTGSKLSKGSCFGRYENGKKWCWQTYDGKKDYAKHSCATFNGYSAMDFCEATSSSSKTRSSGLGAFMAKWAKSKNGYRVRSAATGYRQTQCWDLGMRAIEEARKKGYKIPDAPSSYVWSRHTVSYKQAQPGDIAQFSLWGEKITYPGGGWSTRSTGYRHTAVVTKAYDSSKCEIEMYDQNPSPVHISKYHPCKRTGGSMIIYRISTSSRLYEDGSWPVPEEFQQHVLLSTPLLCAVAVAIVGLLGLVVSRVKSARAKRGQVQLIITDTDLEETPLQ